MKNYRGRLVITKDNKKGRTYNEKGLINGKVPVYLEVVPFVYAEYGTLCDPKTLTIIGYID